LPTGAATESTLSAINTKLPASIGQKVAAQSLPVVLASDQSSIPVTQSGTWNLTNISGTVSLPTGAATEASLARLTLSQGATLAGTFGPLNQAAVNTAAPTYTNGQVSPMSLTTGGALRADLSSLAGTVVATGNGVVGAGVQRVVIASDQTAFNTRQAGKSIANAPVYLDYTGTNVTTGAYVQLVASTTSAASEIEIFDSSGQALHLATGAAASEVNQIVIFAGGNGRVPLSIPAGTRLSVRAITGTANVGFLAINLYA
jgi:hypothetical protein